MRAQLRTCQSQFAVLNWMNNETTLPSHFFLTFCGSNTQRMGAWYSGEFTTVIYDTTKEQYDLNLPDSICEEIVYYALSIVATDMDKLKFVVDQNLKATHKDYRLDFILEETNGSSWNTGGGIIWEYPVKTGVWIFEMLVHRQGFAMAIGVVDRDCVNGQKSGFGLGVGFEYNAGCYGYYHGKFLSYDGPSWQ